MTAQEAIECAENYVRSALKKFEPRFRLAGALSSGIMLAALRMNDTGHDIQPHDVVVLVEA